MVLDQAIGVARPFIYGGLLASYIGSLVGRIRSRLASETKEGLLTKQNLKVTLLAAILDILTISSLVLCVETVFQIIRHTVPSFEWVSQKLGLKIAQALIGLGVTAIGILSHLLKLWKQSIYGIIEVFVGFSTAFIVSATIDVNHLELAKWATLAGAAYVIARGLGNYADGKKSAVPAVRESAAPATVS